ncbi:MAG: LemA family protein [Bacteroidetes bacterium]|nr:LemA family protein [Bacteroidota bacterium]
MRKFLVWGIFFFLLLMILFSGCNSYNSMNSKEKNVTAKWAEVENAYQRRNDLIPNLVAVVKNYADFEKSTLEAVINARANATKITLDPTKLDAESLQKFQQAQGQVSTALGRLLVVAEQYPDLKANQNYMDLQTQLEGTENRITTARKYFIDAVQEYNTEISSFPDKLWSGTFGFKEHATFQMKEGADVPPDVNSLFKK